MLSRLYRKVKTFRSDLLTYFWVAAGGGRFLAPAISPMRFLRKYNYEFFEDGGEAAKIRSHMLYMCEPRFVRKLFSI